MEGFPNNLEPIRHFMLEAIAQKCEGLMLKLLDSAEIEPLAIKEEGAVDVSDEDSNSEADELDEEGEDNAKDDELPKRKGRRKALLATYEPGTFGPIIHTCAQGRLSLTFNPMQTSG